MVLNSIEKQPWIHSVMSYIYLSTFTIIGISLVSIFFSFWMTAQTDSDAHAINLSGSMRMQTFHIGLAATHSPTEVRSLVTRLDHTWNDPLFKPNLLPTPFSDSSSIPFVFQQAYRHWFDIVRPFLLADTKNPEVLFELLIKQVELTDKLVDLFQYKAESKIQHLRTFQLIDLLITILIGGLIFYLLKNRVDIPLSRLTAAAKNIRDGQVQQHIDLQGKDELALLAESFNQMSLSISDTYQQLESRVELRTKELQQSNMILEYSFNVARQVLENQDKEFDYSDIILELSRILMIDDIELLLFTAQDDEPENCHGEVETLSEFPVIHLNKRYGALIVKLAVGTSLQPWQEKLTRSTANQIAIAISLQETKRQENRLAMLNERTVIARELHDSLAQSLSYLKIQVTRLQKSHDHKKYELQQPIIDELREGLSSAYRHLRELLTTFRLKIDETGLKGAIDQAITQLKSRSNMQISLDYRLTNVALSPTEEIHLLQILREASQNAVNHSKGTHLDINLFQLENNEIKLIIQDNGVGLSSHPEKLNHYGLAIIQERSRHLHAELKVKSALDGVRIELAFIPGYLDTNAS